MTEGTGPEEKTVNTTTIETIIGTLQEHQVRPDAQYVAAAGGDYGYVAAWQLPKGDYVLHYGDSGSTDYALTDDVSDLACWLLPGGDDNCDGSEEAPVIVANIRGIDAVKAADPMAEGPFRIIETRYFYGPTASSDWAYDERAQYPREFETYAEAEAAIAEAEEETYVLSHNESGRPSYKIVKV